MRFSHKHHELLDDQPKLAQWVAGKTRTSTRANLAEITEFFLPQNARMGS